MLFGYFIVFLFVLLDILCKSPKLSRHLHKIFLITHILLKYVLTYYVVSSSWFLLKELVQYRGFVAIYSRFVSRSLPEKFELWTLFLWIGEQGKYADTAISIQRCDMIMQPVYVWLFLVLTKEYFTKNITCQHYFWRKPDTGAWWVNFSLQH